MICMPVHVSRMWKNTLLLLAISGFHAAPLKDNGLDPVPPKNVVPVEFRRQGTQPSRRHLVDLKSGLLIEHVNEMQRRIGNFYVPPVTNQFRQGTQNSQVFLVDLLTGLVKSPVGEMERTYKPVYIPHHVNQFRQGTQNSHATIMNHWTGEFLEPAGKMDRSIIQRSMSGQETRAAEVQTKCHGEVINGRCYMFFSTRQTFTEAESTCRQVSSTGHLASVTSADLHSRLVFMVTEANNGPILTWLGGVLQDDQFIWTDGSPWSYADWMPGQSKTEKGKKECLEMFKIDERWWSTTDCGSKRAFICSYPVTD